ncbi:hypothetical protein M0D21_15970 [Aquimarina sp. D1M17]|uniref:hypothetical protein n=1 Tax=Aquimarina acroporae TaxID=2937283 RepID=UPI0020BE2CC1|nr:hypothetical protein [Aquimarina acroporae]MCK8523075.1 hypothetical protein [Aquimarina acroporae]
MERSRNELKNRFKKGDKPTEQDYGDLIDSFLNRLDDDFVASLPDATTTQKGIVEQATLAEVETATDSTRFVTPEGAKRAVDRHAPVKSVNGKTGAVTIAEYQEEDSGWQTPVLLNNVTNYSTAFQGVRYRKKNNIVFIEGMIKGQTADNNTTIVVFKLPTGYRPSKQLVFTCTKTGNVSIRIDVKSNGDVTCYNFGASWTSISGISFIPG